MKLTAHEARTLLKRKGLRATTPRVAVVRLLGSSTRPLSHSEVLEELGKIDWDPATIYRNLTKLAESGVARVVTWAGGMARYELAPAEVKSRMEHPHFVCTDCGAVECLPPATFPRPVGRGKWRASIASSSTQLQGSCPECIYRHTSHK